MGTHQRIFYLIPEVYALWLQTCLIQKTLGSGMVCTWVLESSWAMQPGSGSGKSSYACHSRETARALILIFNGGTHHSEGVMAVIHGGNINPHISLDPTANSRVSEFGFTRGENSLAVHYKRKIVPQIGEYEGSQEMLTA